ncbi:MAG: GNAT family N-acetyltransferase [Burkholderiales bacterium PBB5]|nr:MAG: GNAT family N-acetyltransferase [Burkholderiales bacterium PBB5]
MTVWSQHSRPVVDTPATTDLPALFSRAEDAGLNASAPPQQRWIDGWLVRYSPGKAQRARCIQPVADGRLPLDERLALCAAVYAEAGLGMLARLTPFSRPDGLDAALAARGWRAYDDTRVMVLDTLPDAAQAQPAGVQLVPVSTADYAQIVGALRGSAPAECAAHAERMAVSPVPYQGWVLRRPDDGQALACAQAVPEAGLVGLYDVHTHPQARGQGLAGWLCRQLLVQARAAGVGAAYLQVGADNDAARAVYRRLGFVDAYAYHYRTPAAAGAVD